jgi:Flp pilus assembly protein TadD
MTHDMPKEERADRLHRLESWKEIAAYLGRDVRTVQRWERRSRLPVHRLQHTKRGSVFAYPSELDAWRDLQDPALRSRRGLSVALPMTWIVGAMTAGAVVLVLGLIRPFWPGRAEPVTTHTVSPDVYEKYVTGLFHLDRGDKTNVEESVKYLEATVAADRNFLPAYTHLATAYDALGSTGTGARPVAEVQPKAMVLARRALELDPRSAEAQSALATAYLREWRWSEAEAGYRRALAIDPDDPATHEGIAELLVWRGQIDEGLAHARLARELDPLTVDRTVKLSWLLYHARRYDQAIRELRTVLGANPDHVHALWFLGFALIDSSRLEEAIRTLEHLVTVWDRNPAALGLLARAYGSAGRLADALAIVDELNRAQRAGYVPPAPFLHAYVGLGDRENAFAALERAYRERSHIVQFLRTHPLYDSLRDDSRFSQLIQRVGLE